MNARQALKKVVERNEELEHYNAKCKADITAYNHIIVGMIKGEISPCEWCEEYKECERKEKTELDGTIMGLGCEEWWLSFTPPVVEEVADDDSQGVHVEGSEG